MPAIGLSKTNRRYPVAGACANGQVRIYSRGLEDLTRSFPDVEASVRSIEGSAVIDGEIVGFVEGRVLPFNLFQRRIARKKLSPKLLKEIPAAFIGYDLLFHKGDLLLDEPIERRREALESVFANVWGKLLLSEWRPAESLDAIERLFTEARNRGNEGLMLKRRGSLYESGRRSGEWYKLKKPYATLDVVVTAAEQGQGRRATVLSDYTFAVRSGEQYLNIGKAYSGLTDEEVRELTRRLRGISLNRFGRVYLVRPEVVLEVAFDGIQKSSRHKSGYALRFPRIARWRRDKTPVEADTLERVAELYERSIQIPEALGEP